MDFQEHYIDWRKTRIQAIVQHYGENFFSGKTLLEVGCGHGDIGAHFHDLGAEITCSDARQEHINAGKRKYPHLKFELFNLEKDSLSDYDIILHMGVLYHLGNPDFSLLQTCQHCNHLVLETMVLNTNETKSIKTSEGDVYDSSFNREGNRLSQSYIEKILSENNFRYERYDSENLNSGSHKYDWEIDGQRCTKYNLRRMWFCKLL